MATLHPPISVVVPAFNEEESVGAQIETIVKELTIHAIQHEVIVVDDGSTDRTAERALQHGARVLRHPVNKGYGAALKTGILAAVHDVIVMTDADGTYPVDQIPELVAKLETADMVVGARIGQEVHIPWARKPAKWILKWLATRIAGQEIPDLNSGLRAFRRETVKQYFSVLSNRFSFTTTSTLALLGDDYRVVYHPIDYYQRVGRSKIRPRHFMDFMILVLRMAMLFQPLRVIVPLALACSLMGGVKAGFDILLGLQRIATLGWSTLYQPILSTSSLLLLLGGLQLLLIGMVADGVIRRMGQRNRPTVVSHSIRSFEVAGGERTEASQTVELVGDPKK